MCIRDSRRAVRILAYNSTEITEDNIKQIKSVDEKVQRAFSDMTPAVTIEMIKRGISPVSYTHLDVYKRQIQAVEIMKNKKIDLMIIDVMMPKLDGIRATLQIRKESLSLIHIW